MKRTTSLLWCNLSVFVSVVACSGASPNNMRPSLVDATPDTATPPTDASTPTDIADGSSPTDVADAATPPVDAGGPRVLHVALNSTAHTCAALSTGAVRCWGLNDSGQLGVAPDEAGQRCRIPNRTPPQELPCATRARDVPNVTDAVDVAVGNGTSCALKRDGSVWCWGLNDAGELGQGNSRLGPNPTPVRVDLPTVRQLALGAFHACAVLMDNTVRCWGSNTFGQVGVAPDQSGGRCDEGDGTLSPCVTRPRAVEGLTDVRQVSLGRFHSCVVRNDNTVRCWGLNDSAQLGDGNIVAMEMARGAVVTAMVTDVRQVSVGGSHACAVRNDNTVHCWGWNDLGQIGGAGMENCNGPSGPFRCARRPTAVPGLSGVRSVAAGRFHTCFGLSTGAVQCAGRNDDGQAGIGTPTGETCSFVPDTLACVRMPRDVSVSRAAELGVGDYHSCALRDDGTVRCWGSNAYGQVGDGTTSNRLGPVEVLGVP
jgi:alpha-tubulin suppressor-like RCC1 family protein